MKNLSSTTKWISGGVLCLIVVFGGGAILNSVAFNEPEREIERLDGMRKSMHEILKIQTLNIRAEEIKYEKWERSQNRIISNKEADIVKAKQSLAYWENWHITEAKRLRSQIETSQEMADYQRELGKLQAELATARENASSDSIYAAKILPTVTNKRMRSVYIQSLLPPKKRVADAQERLKAHKRTQPKPFGFPQKRTDQITAWLEQVAQAQEAYRIAVGNRNRTSWGKRQKITKMRTDLLITKASCDSLNVLYTQRVSNFSAK